MNTGNRLLDALSPALRDAVVAKCQQVDLPLRTLVQEQGEMPHFAYFLQSGILSVVVLTADGGSAEVAVVGNEGVIGALNIIGPIPIPAQCFIQMESRALRIKLSDLRTFFLESEELRNFTLQFVQQQSVTMSQIAACNKLHNAEERFARWLLMVRDRVATNQIAMTQEFLAQMLGTRRTTVTVIAGIFQRAGMIEYRRGKLTILEPDKLEQAACYCYIVARDTLRKLYK